MKEKNKTGRGRCERVYVCKLWDYLNQKYASQVWDVS